MKNSLKLFSVIGFLAVVGCNKSSTKLAVVSPDSTHIKDPLTYDSVIRYAGVSSLDKFDFDNALRNYSDFLYADTIEIKFRRDSFFLQSTVLSVPVSYNLLFKDYWVKGSRWNAGGEYPPYSFSNGHVFAGFAGWYHYGTYADTFLGTRL